MSPHPVNKYQRRVVARKIDAKKTKDRSGHVQRKLKRQAVEEQEIENEIRSAARDFHREEDS